MMGWLNRIVTFFTGATCFFLGHDWDLGKHERLNRVFVARCRRCGNRSNGSIR